MSFLQLTFKPAEPKALNESRLVSKAFDSTEDDKCMKCFDDYICRSRIQFVEWEVSDKLCD